MHHVIASRLFATGTAAAGALLGWGLSRWAQHSARRRLAADLADIAIDRPAELDLPAEFDLPAAAAAGGPQGWQLSDGEQVA